MPPKTPYPLDSEHYDEVQGLRESSYALNRTFIRYEDLRAEVAVKKYGALLAHRSLDEAHVKVNERSAVVKELGRVRLKQAERLQSLNEDLKDWRGRAKEPENFPHNQLARDLVVLSATAAIELLIENRQSLTQTHHNSLATLGVNVVLPEASSPLLYRTDLVASYAESSVDYVLKGEDGLTARQTWDTMYAVIVHANSMIEENRNKYNGKVSGQDEKLREKDRLLRAEQEARQREKVEHQAAVKELDDKLESQMGHSNLSAKAVKAELEDSRASLDAAEKRIQFLEGALEAHRQTREEAIDTLRGQIATTTNDHTVVKQNEILQAEVSKLESSLGYVKKCYTTLQEKYDNLKSDRNSLRGATNKLFLAERDTARVVNENKTLQKKLDDVKSEYSGKMQYLVSIQESRQRRFERLEACKEKCKSLEAELDIERSRVKEKENDIAGLRACRSYIEFIGKRLQGTPSEPKAVASKVLRRIKELESQQEDQSMSADDTVRNLNEKIDALNLKAIEHASESGRLQGQFDNECANHETTRRDLKHDHRYHSKQIEQLQDTLAKGKARVQQLEEQASEDKSELDQLKLDEEQHKHEISMHVEKLTEKDKLLAQQAEDIDDVDTAVARATESLQQDLQTAKVELASMKADKTDAEGKLVDIYDRVDSFKLETEKANRIISASQEALGLGSGADLVDAIKQSVQAHKDAARQAEDARRSSEQRLSAKNKEIDDKLSAKDSELQEKLTAKDEDLKKEQDKVQEAKQRSAELNDLLSSANNSLNSLKAILNLAPDAEYSIVERNLNNAVAHIKMVFSARRELKINETNGDVIAAIKKLQEDLINADSTASTALNTKQSKEELQQVINKIRGTLQITAPDADVAEAVEDVRGRLNIAEGDQDILRKVRQAFGFIEAHRDAVMYAEDLKGRADKYGAIVRGAKAQLGDTVQDDTIVKTIAEWMERATSAEQTVSRARILLSIDPSNGDVHLAIRSLKTKALAAEKERDLVKQTFGFTSASTFAFDVAGINIRLDTAEQALKSARTSLHLAEEGDVEQAVSALNQEVDDLRNTCENLANSFGIASSEDMTYTVAQLRNRLDQAISFAADGRLDSTVYSLINKHAGNASLVSSVKQALKLGHEEQELVRAILLVQGELSDAKSTIGGQGEKIEFATDTLELTGGFEDGIRSIKSRLGAAESTANTVRESFQISTDDNLLERLQEHIKNVSHVRDVLGISGELQAGVSAVKEKIHSLESTIFNARTELNLLESNTDLLPGISGAISDATEAKKKLEAKEKEVDSARTLLGLTASTSLSQGISTLQGQLSQATDTTNQARASLDPANPEVDVEGAIKKVKQEVDDARTLLSLTESTSLSQGIRALQEELHKVKNIVEEANKEFADTGLQLVDAITDMKSKAQQTNTDLDANQRLINETRGLLKLTATADLQAAIARLQEDLKLARSTLEDTRKALALPGQDADISLAIADLKIQLQTAKQTVTDKQTQIQEVEKKFEDQAQENEELLKSFQLQKGHTLKSGAVFLRDRYNTILENVHTARGLLGIQGSTIQLTKAIDNLNQRSASAEQIIQNATASLSLASGVTLEVGINSRLGELASARKTINDARTLLNLSASDTLDSGIRGVQQRLATAKQSLSSLNDSGYGLQKSLVSLVLGKQLSDNQADLQRYKTLHAKIHDTGNKLPIPEWYLAMASVPFSLEQFEQLTERLRALMVLGGEVLDRLAVLEDLMQQVNQCSHHNLVDIYDMLLACWRSNGYMVGGDVTEKSTSTPQSDLQVLSEARLLELLIRGTSVLQLGWGSVSAAIQGAWLDINKSVIDNIPVLQAYRAWFTSLDATPTNLLQELHDIVTASNSALSCHEMAGQRVLVADVMRDGSYCFLWDVVEKRGSLYPVAELHFNSRSAIVMFPGRRQSGGVVTTDAPFTEPMPKVFVMRNMNSLHIRG